MVKRCPQCRSTELLTDYGAGNVVCQNCFAIVEEGILVSEVGFSESAGGRVHVQGSFVSHFATGVAGIRGSGGQQSTAKIKEDGQQRIRLVGEAMHIEPNVIKGAQRLFGIAVDNKFNRGRRTEYIVASCLYLQCRMKKESKMLIDFSERLSINVYELGGTYMKLRSTLSITEPMPEVDPAIYNLRFANKLSFPNAIMTNTIAADASKLIRRFAADWMTQGRRPAGLCGACLIIAGRMHNFLRTPDEVAQVVKTSPLTIQKRLKEFAQTSIAKKTVEEFRNMSEQELFQDNEEVPPIVKEQRERERRRQEKERRAELARQRAEGSQAVDEQAAQASGSQAGTPAADEMDIDAEAEAAVRQVMEEYDVGAEGSQAADEEDDNLEPMNAGDYRRELDAAGDDPKAAQAEWQRERSSFLRSSMPPASMSATLVNPATMSTQMTFVDPGLDPALSKAAGKRRRAEHDEDGEADQGEDEDELAELGDKEEGFNPASSPVAERERKPARREFTEWDDEPAMIQYLEETYFAEDVRLLQLTKQDIGTRIREWLKGRDPREVIREMTLVEGAYKARERGAKVKEEAFPDIDDDELDRYWVMEEDERDTRARMWLSSNGKWLEEEKARQEKRAAAKRAEAESHGPGGLKPKTKRKRPGPRKTPYKSAREAIQGIASEKKFSTRVNYDALRSIPSFGEGLGIDAREGEDESGLFLPGGLERFDDEKEEEDEVGGDEKYDEDDMGLGFDITRYGGRTKD